MFEACVVVWGSNAVASFVEMAGDIMKVVMITPDSQMIDRRILHEAKTLMQRGHSVTLLAGFECSEDSQYVDDGVEIYRFKYDWDDERLKEMRKRLPGNDYLKTIVNRVFMFWARRFFRIDPFNQFMIHKLMQLDADVIHVHDLPCLLAGVYVSQKTHVPLIYDAHELYYAQDVLPERLQRKYFSMEKKLISVPDKVITVNPFLSKLMAERYRIKEPNVIMNCTYTPSEELLTENKQFIKHVADIPMDGKVVLYQGWISAERNIDTLVKGVKYFPDNAYLVLVGYGAYEEYLKKLAVEDGSTGKIRFLGRVPSDEMMKYTAGADIGVIPYMAIDDNHLYCSPNKMFEYVVSEIPIITERLPFFELMRKQYGFIYPTDMSSAESFGNDIRLLLSSESLLHEMKQNTVRAAIELNWENEGRKLVAIYDAIRN